MTAPRVRVQRRPVHGVVLLDKPIGLSSNQALQKVKWLLRAEKAGHTGTLDPLATGVLPLCFGAATKFSQQHLDADKVYETTLRLGVRTSTADAEGEVVSERPVACSVIMPSRGSLSSRISSVRSRWIWSETLKARLEGDFLAAMTYSVRAISLISNSSRMSPSLMSL